MYKNWVKKSHININDPNEHAEGEKKESEGGGVEAVNFLAISVALEEIWNLKKIEQDFYICVPLQFDWFRELGETLERALFSSTLK